MRWSTSAAIGQPAAGDPRRDDGAETGQSDGRSGRTHLAAQRHFHRFSFVLVLVVLGLFCLFVFFGFSLFFSGASSRSTHTRARKQKS